ncbi:MAG: hypothetical protein OYH76_13285 [Defluviicoccus sp.]|nr:hypothetical protein [Defluviicoccus sp.]MDE0276862.1 hypothetical protein [Defluviicoccus sp.]
MFQSLYAAVYASAYRLRGETVSLERLRQASLERSDECTPSELTIDTPNEELTALQTELAALLARFTFPESEEIAFRPPEGWHERKPATIQTLALGLIKAAVYLGEEQAIDILCSWLQGEPAQYTQVFLLRELSLEESVHSAHPIRLHRASSVPTVVTSAPGIMRVRSNDGAVLFVDHTMEDVFLDLSDDANHFRFFNEDITSPSTTLEMQINALSLACDISVSVLHWWTEHSLPMTLLNSTCTPLILSYNESGRAADVIHNRRLTSETMENANQIVEKLEGREDLTLAIRRWKNSKRSSDIEDQLIDLRIALEVLYAKGGSGEMRFRISLIGAIHLGHDLESRNVYYKTLRDTYDRASRVVHGDYKLDDSDEGLIRSAQDACRKAILKRLDEPEKPDWKEFMLKIGVSS